MKIHKQTISFFGLCKKGIVTLSFLVVMLLSSIEGHASHNRYSNIAWSRVNSSTRTITVTVTQAWRRSFFGATPVGSVVNTSTLLFGDGVTTPINLTVTSVNIADDWFYGSFTTTHTYAGVGTSFTLSYSDCCRISSLMNNAGGNYSSQSIVNLVAGNTGSPISSTPPIINLPIGQAAAAFNIPAVDPDGGVLTYGLATFAQTSATNPSGLAINATGNATFNTIGKTAGQLWQGAFVITDANGSNTVVDFIMLMVAPNTPPIFDYSITPINGAVFNINPGQNVNFGIKALDIDVGSTVTLSAVGLPTSNFTFTPTLPTTANPVSTNFSFTPSVSQLGIYIITFTATRNGGIQTSTNLTINVNANPQFILPTKLEATNYVILSGVLNVDTVTASNPDLAVNTSITSGTFPAGATMSPALPTAFSTIPTTQMSWTPTPADFGAHNVSFLATDTNGRTATRNYVLEVNTVTTFNPKSNETISPCLAYSYAITAVDPDIPFGDIVEIMEASPLPSWLTLTSTGNGTALLSGTPSTSDAGIYTISLDGEDLYHHVTGIANQTFTIEVLSVTPPVTPVLVDYIGGECSGTPPTPTTTDVCGGIVNGTTTTTFPITAQGTTPVTWSFNDGNGNITEAIQNVIINDVTPPTITCPSNIVLNACQATANWTVPTASDNCLGVTVTQTAGSTPGSTFANGTTTTITYKATDVGGNESSCSFTVTRANALNLTVANSNPQLYFGYSLDQSTTIKGTPTGGVGPYTVVITMNRILACNVLTNNGDEVWTASGGASTGNTCPASGPGVIPISTATVNSGGFYSVTTTLLSNAVITVTVTDANGCSTTKTTNVYAEDARCFAGNSGNAKVKICHRTGNANDPCHVICVDQSAVAAHLAHGDYLGVCLPNCATPPVYKASDPNLFNVTAYPNPSKNDFTIVVEGNLNKKIQVEVYDILSRKVNYIESSDGEPIQFGDNLPSGAYFVIVTQENNQKTIKLIKE
jgi:hypothetical protein